MATLERYSSFEEIDEAQERDHKASRLASNKKKESSKKTSGQNLFKEFGELLRKGKVSTPTQKK